MTKDIDIEKGGFSAFLVCKLVCHVWDVGQRPRSPQYVNQPLF
jgi:hypothetical protein